MADLNQASAARAFAQTLPHRADLQVEERAGLGLISVMARRDAALADIEAALKCALPGGSQRAASGHLSAIGTGPRVWLVMLENAASAWADDVAGNLRGLASVSDQSSGYAVLRLRGSAARDVLSRGAFIDLAPARFGPGAAATTTIAQIGVTFWALEDGLSFDLALPRSMASSFHHWMAATAAGLDLGASAHR